MATTTHPLPTTRTYWLVAAFLGVVTAVEIAISYADFLGPVGGVLLVTLGIVKFVAVVAVFMHLRYDLHGYRFLFLLGVIGALVVFSVVLAAMQAIR